MEKTATFDCRDVTASSSSSSIARAFNGLRHIGNVEEGFGGGTAMFYSFACYVYEKSRRTFVQGGFI